MRTVPRLALPESLAYAVRITVPVSPMLPLPVNVTFTVALPPAARSTGAPGSMAMPGGRLPDGCADASTWKWKPGAPVPALAVTLSGMIDGTPFAAFNV